MALSERATHVVTTIDNIIKKNGLNAPAFPILIESRPRSSGKKSVSILETPKIKRNNPSSVSFNATSEIAPPKTPFTPSFIGSKSGANLTEGFSASMLPEPTSSLRFEDNPKSAAYTLLQEIKEKINNSGDEYLKFDNSELRKDVEKINRMLEIKFGIFRTFANDFIILVDELSVILNTEDRRIFERHVESQSSVAMEQSREKDSEPRCSLLFAKCRLV